MITNDINQFRPYAFDVGYCVPGALSASNIDQRIFGNQKVVEKIMRQVARVHQGSRQRRRLARV